MGFQVARPSTALETPARPRRRGRHRAQKLMLAVTAILLAVIVGQVAFGLGNGKGSTPRTACFSRLDLSQIPQMESRLGRTFDCSVVYNNVADNWIDWQKPWFTVAPASQPQFQWQNWVRASTSRFLVVTQSLVPNGAPTDWRVRGARGEYDQHFRILGDNLVAKGLGNSIIRLGHEANGDWYFDNIGTTPTAHAAWAKYWARAAAALKSTPGSHFRLDWTVAAGVWPTRFLDYYPGNGAVDIIGADIYDQLPAGPVTQPQRWMAEANAPGGVTALLRFAKAQNKPESLSEWGLVSSKTNGGGGDDPYFVNQIADLIKSNPIVYQNYFETQMSGGVLGLELASREAWIARFGSRGDVHGS